MAERSERERLADAVYKEIMRESRSDPAFNAYKAANLIEESLADRRRGNGAFGRYCEEMTTATYRSLRSEIIDRWKNERNRKTNP